MDSQEILKLINAYPIILTLLWMALGGLVVAIPSVFVWGLNKGRRKAEAVELAEAKDAIRVAHEARENEKKRGDILESEMVRMKEVVHYHGYPFLRNAPAPHHPLCPSCLALDVRTPMIIGINLDGFISSMCPIKKCDVSLKLTKDVVDDLLNCDLTALPRV